MKRTIQISVGALSALLLAGIFSGCSKQKQVEHHIEKVKDWNISKIDYEKIQSGTGAVVKVATEANVGVMTFNKDGSGSYDYTIDGQHRSGTFTWTNKVDNVTFNYVATSTSVVQVVNYSILDQSAKTMTLQGSEVIVDVSSGAFVLNATFYLSK